MKWSVSNASSREFIRSEEERMLYSAWINIKPEGGAVFVDRNLDCFSEIKNGINGGYTYMGNVRNIILFI